MAKNNLKKLNKLAIANYREVWAILDGRAQLGYAAPLGVGSRVLRSARRVYITIATEDTSWKKPPSVHAVRGKNSTIHLGKVSLQWDGDASDSTIWGGKFYSVHANFPSEGRWLGEVGRKLV